MREQEVEQGPVKKGDQDHCQGKGELSKGGAKEPVGPPNGDGNQRHGHQQEVEAVQREGTALSVLTARGARCAVRKPPNITSTPKAWPT